MAHGRLSGPLSTSRQVWSSMYKTFQVRDDPARIWSARARIDAAYGPPSCH
jgi:hypothetical protein